MATETKFLLDTHVLLWWLGNDDRLSEDERKIIANPRNVIAVSVVSAWEMVIKKSIGKLTYPDNLRRVLEEGGFSVIPVELGHVLELESLADHHRDPFDRLLACQARTEKFTLITGDEKIWAYDVPLHQLN